MEFWEYLHFCLLCLSLSVSLFLSPLFILSTLSTHVHMCMCADFRPLSKPVALYPFIENLLFVILEFYPSCSKFYSRGQKMEENYFRIALSYWEIVMNHNMAAAVNDAMRHSILSNLGRFLRTYGLEKHQTLFLVVVWAKGSQQPCNFHRELVHPCEM